MAKAAAAPAAASREESRVWPRTAAPVVAAAEEADLEADEEALEAAVPVVEVPVLVAETEPDRVVLVPVACELPVLVSVELPVEVPEEVPVAAAEPEEEPADEVQEMVLGRSVTPPREQMPLATWRVAAAMKKTLVSGYSSNSELGVTYSPDRPGSTCQPHSRQCC
jgi:hypothetical protein